MTKVGRGAQQAMIRLPDGLRDRIKIAASVNGRSLNSEIVFALERAFPEPADQLSEAAAQMLDALKAVYEALPGLPLGSDAAIKVQAAIAKAEGRNHG